MEIPTKYNPALVEDKWYKYWLDNNLFRSVPDHREPYCIVIPPPNVTGVLHMGHMLNNTIQDVLIRRARMQGKNTCWVPGTDHASIATEAKVVAKLKAEGIDKNKLTRDEFLAHAWEWKEKHGGIILEQLKKMGAACDWERTAFTMDEKLSASVIHVFVDLYNKGQIYRGVRMVNWDPQAKTAVSDEEVIYREVKSKLYHLKYPMDGEDGFVVIATTRPETILGDTALCVNPKDPRYTHLKGKRVLVPLINRSVPIIYDEYVDMEFGTGALKVTPAHDINDYMLGDKHNLESVDIFNDDGTMSPAAQLYIGMDRFEVRKAIVKDLEAAGHIAKIEDYTNKVGYSERTDAVIEPKLSMQWFLKMQEISKPALEAVLNGEIKLHPHKYINTYRHWMENVKDWCLSRQLWWGHRIPAWYLPDGGFVVAENEEEALKLAREKTGNRQLNLDQLKQDEDVLDTWFSSWLWPISVFDGIKKPDNPDIQYYYPTNDLVTAPDILFFWVARMIIAGYEYTGKRPFNSVYLTGMVRDSQRRKMSKQLGNSPDPLDLMAKYGADGMRVGMLLCSPAGNDLLFDESLPEQGRNFCNKIWNAFRLVQGWTVGDSIAQPLVAKASIEWFENVLNKAIAQLNADFDKYRISDALMNVYKLFWDEFSSWLLEMVKPAYQQPIDGATYRAVISLFERLIVLLHPFMPFITEELWQHIYERKGGQSIMNCSLPKTGKFDKKLLEQFETAKEIITSVRSIRQEKSIPNKNTVSLLVKGNIKLNEGLESVISKLAGLDKVEYVTEKVDGAMSFMVQTTEFFVPLAGLINVDEEIEKLNNELNYYQGFLASVLKKLGNEKFINGAPEQVVAAERRKQSDAEAKIKALLERISGLAKG
ncbi:MAG TPA: valine--tRNA ligase [Tenuifilaceae bacterium]|nr:valine--tRNA ligase [Bacteroidales bacterium]MDI9516887.1 valine--tRNA ligase [Bacteroidota bacterium]NLH56398.1 valine--tRNA ligase [Rikenellaceae bacterium]OQC63182.1 MAG: Valine--tRNA ligase [Bacteroidetes bacterium ADurb.Bin008]HOF91187.1 valine--tRNA ligase [Tenuifilaceae bacterium]